MRKRALLEPNEAAEAHSWFVSKDFISFFLLTIFHCESSRLSRASTSAFPFSDWNHVSDTFSSLRPMRRCRIFPPDARWKKKKTSFLFLNIFFWGHRAAAVIIERERYLCCCLCCVYLKGSRGERWEPGEAPARRPVHKRFANIP